MKTLLLALVLTGAPVVPEKAAEDAILFFSGAMNLEELEQEVLDNYEQFYHNKLKINTASKTKLVSSGLFSNYQAAALVDYITNNGSILSFAELELVNGMNPDLVQRLRPFISLESSGAPGQRNSRSSSASISARAQDSKGALKLNLSLQECLTINLSSGNYLWGQKFDSSQICSSISYSASNWNLTLGDFNAKFGQGLSLWSGFSMSGAGSSRLDKNPGGIVPASGWTRGSRLRGAAIGMDRTCFDATLLACTDKMIAANANFRSLSAQAGITAIIGEEQRSMGADCKIKMGNLDFFADLAFSQKLAALAGLAYSPRYLHNYSLLARFYPQGFNSHYSGAIRSASKCSDEIGLSAVAAMNKLSVSFDAAYHPSKGSHHFKGILQWKPVFQLGNCSLKPELKLNCRYRPLDKYPLRTELKTEIKADMGAFLAGLNSQILQCRNFAWLLSAQAGYSSDKLGIFLSGCIYNVPHWDDRIYAWQRDLPGSFNVPAFYGKGWSAALVARYKKTLYLRVSNKEIKLQYVKNIFHPHTAGTLD